MLLGEFFSLKIGSYHVALAWFGTCYAGQVCLKLIYVFQVLGGWCGSWCLSLPSEFLIISRILYELLFHFLLHCKALPWGSLYLHMLISHLALIFAVFSRGFWLGTLACFLWSLELSTFWGGPSHTIEVANITVLFYYHQNNHWRLCWLPPFHNSLHQSSLVLKIVKFLQVKRYYCVLSVHFFMDFPCLMYLLLALVACVSIWGIK